MGVGDGVGQAVDDKMDGSGGVGVEAAAVVVITLLAVLGNAMVVATLVRRSLLHHPSNRLVLSLTGSNLILTVVVLPGMVTSLLMTSASPSNQHPTQSHHFSESGIVSPKICNESIALLDNHDDGSSVLSQEPKASFLSSQYQNNSSIMLQSPNDSSISQHSNNSSISQHGVDSNISSTSYDSDAFPLSHFQNIPAVTSSAPSYFTTTSSPLYLDVSPVLGGPPVSLYDPESVSLLSKPLENAQPAWHHSTDSSQNLQHALALAPRYQQKSIEAEKFENTFPEERFSKNIETPHNPSQIKTHHEQNSNKDHNITELRDDGEDQKQKTGGKELISRSIHNHKAKSFRNDNSKDHLQEREIVSFTGDKSGISQVRTNHQQSKSKSKLEERSRIAYQDNQQENDGMIPDENKVNGMIPDEDKVNGMIPDENKVNGMIPDEDKVQQKENINKKDTPVIASKRPSNPLEEEANHTANRRRKQGTRHYQHRKQRIRRTRDTSADNESVQVTQIDNYKPQVENQRPRKLGEVEGNNIKESIRKGDQKTIFNEYNIPEDDEDQEFEKRKLEVERSNARHSSGYGHIKQEVQVQIKQQEQSGKHVILVRGVQEIEEQQEKQMVVVVVDQEEQHEQHQGQQHQIHLTLQQHIDNLHQRGIVSSNSNTGERGREDEEKRDRFDVDRRPKLTVSDPKEHEDQQNYNHSSPGMRISSQVHKQDQQPLEIYVQEQVVNNQEVEVQQIELKELQKEHQEENEMEEVQQLYGGVEWESDRWEGGRILCQGAAFFTNLITAASALTVAVIAIDRYLAIVRPLVYGVMVTKGRCLLMLAWCWTQALLTALPPLLGWARYERREPYGRCGVAWGDSPSYTAVWTISVFLIPFSIMLVCYYHILQVARNKCRRIRVGKVSETSPPNTPDPGSACLDGFPFPLSVGHLGSPPIGSKPTSPLASSPILGKVSHLGNLPSPPLGNRCNLHPRSNATPQGNEPGLPLVKSNTANGLDSYLDKPVQCRSYSVGGLLRVTDSTTNTNDSTIKPKRKLADFGRSRSLCQVPQQPPRPCLRRVQSTFSVRHTLKKLSLGTRRPSWNWEGSPSKGFWTVFVVMGAHMLSWGPYTCMAIAEAILGRERLLLLPHWVMVTCTLLLFTASVFYPIVYGMYNRNIRKELLTCLCPAWSRRRGSHLRRPSTLPSYSGSVLDFTSLRQRSASEKPEQCNNPANGITGTIATISSTVGSLACPTPLMIMAQDDSLPTRGYNLNLRKPSQDSGTVMVGGDDQDSDVEGPVPVPRHHTTRRVSAPSVLSTVREDPHTTAVCIEDPHQVSRHHSMNSRNLPITKRKSPILPLSVQLLSASPVVRSSLRRSHSLDKINSGDKDMILDNKITYRSLRKKRSTPIMRETQFNTPPTSDRMIRRRGSVAVMKVMAIPEDCGLPEYPEVTDSGRGSVDSAGVSKTRTLNGRGSVDSTDLTKTFSLRCRGSVDSTDVAKVQGFSRRGSVDSTELAMARAINKRENGDNIDVAKNPATRQVSIDEGIGGDCLPEEETSW